MLSAVAACGGRQSEEILLGTPPVRMNTLPLQWWYCVTCGNLILFRERESEVPRDAKSTSYSHIKVKSSPVNAQLKES